MDFTFELSKIYNVLPFEILKQDKDEVIMLLNYMAEKAENAQAQKTPVVNKAGDNAFIKVNNKTATGGWW